MRNGQSKALSKTIRTLENIGKVGLFDCTFDFEVAEWRVNKPWLLMGNGF